jgi:uncharacterized membrane protein
MILRRVIKHFRNQEWTAIFLDFLIVVVGVFVGLQVANWNDAQRVRAQEEKYLERIVVDLRADLNETELVGASAEWRLSALEAILKKAGAAPRRTYVVESRLVGRKKDFTVGDILPFQSDDPYAANMAIIAARTFVRNSHTYDALVNTGEFQLFHDQDLVRRIQIYYAEVEHAMGFEGNMGIRLHAALDTRLRLGVSMPASITLDELAKLVVTDIHLKAELQTLWFYTNTDRVFMEVLHDKAKALINEIEGRNQ